MFFYCSDSCNNTRYLRCTLHEITVYTNSFNYILGQQQRKGRKQISLGLCVNVCDRYHCGSLTVRQKAFMVWLKHGPLLLQMHCLAAAVSSDADRTPRG